MFRPKGRREFFRSAPLWSGLKVFFVVNVSSHRRHGKTILSVNDEEASEVVGESEGWTGYEESTPELSISKWRRRNWRPRV